MKYPSSKSEPGKSINFKPDVKPYSNRTPFSPKKMTTSPNNLVKKDTKSKKYDPTQFKSNKETLSSPLSSDK